MTNLGSITALGATTPRTDIVGPLTIVENPDWALASLAVRQEAGQEVAKHMQTLTGLALPPAGALVANDTYTLWWIGPDQWMIAAHHTTHENLPALVKSAVGAAGSVTEQTDGWCWFDIIGANAPALFERLCPANLRSMADGSATRTTLHHLGCFLLRRASGWAVLGPRSSAGSLHHALITTAHAIA